MFDLGMMPPVTLGDTIRLSIPCRNGSGVATAPDSAPAWSAYLLNGGDDSAIDTGTLSGSDADSKTGFRTGDAAITGGNGFAAGNIYKFLYTYEISSTEYNMTETMLVQ